MPKEARECKNQFDKSGRLLWPHRSTKVRLDCGKSAVAKRLDEILFEIDPHGVSLASCLPGLRVDCRSRADVSWPISLL